jgi:DNA-binding transcriptional MerR regulator
MPQPAPKAPYTFTWVCRTLGATRRAIRHYETCGLVTCSRDGPRRTYSPEVFQQLQLIVQARRASLSISEIRQLLQIGDGARQHALRAEVLDAERSHLGQILADLGASPCIPFAVPG